MKNKISKRRLKIQNKKRHENILFEVSKEYTINKKVFGNGYFIFEFDVNTICWFFLNEFPDWKFAIWLNDDGYEIFGEAIVQIDKFKPSASTLSETDVIPFLKELKNIQNNVGEWKQYNKETEEIKIRKKKEEAILQQNLKNINNLIKEEYEKYERGEVKSFLEIYDRNKGGQFCVSPRFVIEEYAENQTYFDTDEAKERTANLFEKMSNLMTYIGNWPDGKIDYNREYLSVDSILFEHRELENPKDFLESEIRYERKEPISDFKYLVLKFKDELS